MKKQIMGWVLGWVLKHEASIINGFQQKGGWEGWAQVELNDVFGALPGATWVQREHGIYTSSMKAVDFLVGFRDGSYSCIELKCESLFHSANQGTQTKGHGFYKEVLVDIEKLRHERTAEYSGAAAYIVAITVSEEAAETMATYVDNEFESIPYNGYNIRVFVAQIS